MSDRSRRLLALGGCLATALALTLGAWAVWPLPAGLVAPQLARLLRPAPSRRTWGAKLLQVLWALRLERHLTKQAILEQYLNRVPLGQGAIGVAAGARLYFDASATRLSLAQAALLAGLARAPSTANPFVSSERAQTRRAQVLVRIRDAGYAAGPELARAAAEPLLPQRSTPPFLAPHFPSRLPAWSDEREEALDGWRRTSLHLALQTRLEGEVRHTVQIVRDRGVERAAVVVLDNRTGDRK